MDYNIFRPRVLILSCSTGEGHNSAAAAIAESLKARGNFCEVRDVLSFASPKAAKRSSRIYSGIITKVPFLFGAAYLIGGWYDKSRLPSPIYRANAKYSKNLYEYIENNGVECVICTHLFAMEAMTAVKAKHNCAVKAYGVLTDYASIPFYKDTKLDGYFVPDKRTAEEFCKKTGTPAETVYATGIPVRRSFSQVLEKNGARRILGLGDKEQVICILTGGAGCGNISALCGRLLKSFPEARIFAMTGNNGRLNSKLRKKYGGNAKLTVCGFTQDIPLYVKAADAVISKAGGLSSTETAVCEVPLIHLKAIPGVESRNLKYFSQNGLSLRAKGINGAVKCVNAVLYDGVTAGAMRVIQAYNIPKDASEKIAGAVTEGICGERVDIRAFHCLGVCFGERDVLQDNTEADFA